MQSTDLRDAEKRKLRNLKMLKPRTNLHELQAAALTHPYSRNSGAARKKPWRPVSFPLILTIRKSRKTYLTGTLSQCRATSRRRPVESTLRLPPHSLRTLPATISRAHGKPPSREGDISGLAAHSDMQHLIHRSHEPAHGDEMITAGRPAPRRGNPFLYRAGLCLALAAALVASTSDARAQSPEEEDEPPRTAPAPATIGYRISPPFDPEIRQVSAQEPAPDDSEGTARLNAIGSVFSPEEREELKRLFLQTLKEENDRKTKAEKEKKAKEAEEPYEIGSNLNLNGVWNNGLVFQSPNKDWVIHFGGRLQWYVSLWDQPNDMQRPAPGGGGVPNALPTTSGVGNLQESTFFRRVRLRSDGVGYELVEYVLEVDFEQLNLITFDHMWAGMKDVPILQTVRVGQLKVPQGMEMIGSDYHLTFLERSSMSDAFWTLFGQGIFIGQNYFDDNVVFQTMFHRIQPTQFFTNDFGDGDWAETSRLTWTPYYADEGRHLFHVGGSYQWRRSDLGASIQPGGTGNANADLERVVRFRARPEQRDGTGVAGAQTATFSFPGFGNTNRFIDTGYLLASAVNTWSPELLWINGPFSIQAEGAAVRVEDAKAAIKVPGSNAPPVGTSYGNPFFWGGYAQASYFLTGENRGYDRRMGMYDRPKVRENFYITKDGCKKVIHSTGAWELGYRYSYIDLDSNGLNGGTMGQHTFGVNWYMNDNLKMQFQYLNIQRGVELPAVSGTVHAFGLMTQWYF